MGVTSPACRDGIQTQDAIFFASGEVNSGYTDSCSTPPRGSDCLRSLSHAFPDVVQDSECMDSTAQRIGELKTLHT